MPRNTGTREWAVKNVNCVTGCEHACLYCYGASMAARFNRVTSPQAWSESVVRMREVNRNRRRILGRVMFPTTHDITPRHLEPCMTVLGKLLTAGNEVLIVSKPHLECVERMCEEFAPFKKQILFRFTIGAYDNEILKFWEPKAPTFEERFSCLKLAHGRGYSTSISGEPMLDLPNVAEWFNKLAPFVTDSIWIGKLNRARSCIRNRTPEIETAICRQEANQTDEKIRSIYDRLKDSPLVQWKDSIKGILGLAGVV